MRLRVSDPLRNKPLSRDERGRRVQERLTTVLRADRERRRADAAPYGYDFDANGGLTAITEPDGSRTTFAYDGHRRLAAVTHAGGRNVRYHYDPDDRLHVVDDAGVQHRYDYDAAGRLARVRHGRTAASTYRYDENGRLSVARTGTITTRYTHLEHGLRIEQTCDGVSIEAELGYDMAGRLCRLRVPGGTTLRHVWAEGEWSAVQLDGRTLADVEVREYDDIDGRPVRLAGKEYVYLPDGRLERLGGLTFAYDEHGQLTSATGEGKSWRYAYDACGNRVPDPAVHLSHDRRGRLIGRRGPDGELAYRYDDAGQLVEVRRNGTTVGRFGYDHAGRLAVAFLGARTERYLYAPDGTLLAVTDGSGRPLRVPVRTPRGVLAELTPAGLRYLRCDHLQTVYAITDESGDLVAELDYGPYGEPVADSGRRGATFGGRTYYPELGLYEFGSRWYDPALGRFLTPDSYTARPDDARLTHPFGTGARQVADRTGWLPAWLGQPRQRNPYAFCANDPVNRFDPDGHWSLGWLVFSLLGAIWTLPNTLLGVLLEVTCLINEPMRWLLDALGAVRNWQAVGFDAASSGRLNAFALVFIGGWMGTLLDGIDTQALTFGNVFFLNRTHGDTEAVVYEHELRHTIQFAGLGPLFYFVYLCDIIVSGYDGSALEQDALRHEKVGP